MKRQSARRESNPRVRLGKAVGSRYITGTRQTEAELSKRTESTGWESNPRFRVTKAESWPLDHQCIASCLNTLPSRWDQRDSNPHSLVKSQVCRQ